MQVAGLFAWLALAYVLPLLSSARCGTDHE